MCISVISLTGPNGRCTLDFIDAIAECISRGMVIASRADLLQARSEGYELCSCGWLSEGFMGLVLQSYQSWCWGSYSADVLICDQYRGNVYCLL